jgi:hypothetical protein
LKRSHVKNAASVAEARVIAVVVAETTVAAAVEIVVAVAATVVEAAIIVVVAAVVIVVVPHRSILPARSPKCLPHQRPQPNLPLNSSQKSGASSQ